MGRKELATCPRDTVAGKLSVTASADRFLSRTSGLLNVLGAALGPSQITSLSLNLPTSSADRPAPEQGKRRSPD